MRGLARGGARSEEGFMVSNLKNMFTSRQRSSADDFEKTIVNIMSPYRLKDLCPAMHDAPNTQEDNLGEQMFKIRQAKSVRNRIASPC